MISCTEFIPAYSELFTFLENRYGWDEVKRFWKYLFEPTGEGIPLIRFVQKEGIRGCFDYWAGTLNEEAADFTMYLNEPAGWFRIIMHRCPSKGRLLQLKEEMGLEPYRNYCLHCDSYRSAIEKVGLAYIYDFCGIENASCSILIYDPKVFQGQLVVDEHTEVMERKASQNVYFHKDFHSSMNMGIDYLGTQYGDEAVCAYLTQYAKDVYAPLFQQLKAEGLPAMERKILDTYRNEQASDAVETTLTDHCLRIHVKACPAVTHLHETGRTVSKWFPCTTEYVMQAIADEMGWKFTMEQYCEETGEAAYRFEA